MTADRSRRSARRGVNYSAGPRNAFAREWEARPSLTGYAPRPPWNLGLYVQRLEGDRAQAVAARPSEGSAISPTIAGLRALHFFFLENWRQRKHERPRFTTRCPR